MTCNIIGFLKCSFIAAICVQVVIREMSFVWSAGRTDHSSLQSDRILKSNGLVQQATHVAGYSIEGRKIDPP